MHKIKPTFWLCSVLILWRICMRSLARAIHTLFQTPPPPPRPWSLALPHWRFSPAASPGAVLTTLDRCPLNIDLHWRSPHQIEFARVLVSTTATYHLRLKNFLTAVPNIWEFGSRPLVHTRQSENKNGIEPLPHLETLPRIRFGLRIEYSLADRSWLQLPAKTSSRLFPRSEELHPPESNLGFSLWFIWRTFQHRGLNRLDEVKCAIFQGTFNSNCIGSRIWWTGCGTWNVVSPSRLPKNTVTSLSARQMEKSPFDKVGTVLKTQKSVIITYKLSYIRLFRTALPYLLSIIPLFFKWSHLAGSWILEI